jgi:hypothetical protein
MGVRGVPTSPSLPGLSRKIWSFAGRFQGRQFVGLRQHCARCGQTPRCRSPCHPFPPFAGRLPSPTRAVGQPRRVAPPFRGPSMLPPGCPAACLPAALSPAALQPRGLPVLGSHRVRLTGAGRVGRLGRALPSPRCSAQVSPFRTRVVTSTRPHQACRPTPLEVR